MVASHPSQKINYDIEHPGAIFIQLTTSCNARCINCPHPFTYGREGKHPKGVMSNDIWNKIIGDIQSMGYRNQVGFYLHHEPLMDQSLFRKIIQINEETDAFAVISTNASLLNEKNRKAMIRANPRIVHININSAEKRQYESMMGLKYESTIQNTRRFIAEAAGKLQVEINCPVLPEVDTDRLIKLFPDVKVNTEYWANSRGGLLEGITAKDKGSRFKISNYCLQPEQNFNILFDGSIIICCLDWAHESKEDFPNIMESSIQDIYGGDLMRSIINEFKSGNYSRYQMCEHCSKEMGFDNKNISDAASKASIFNGNKIDEKNPVPSNDPVIKKRRNVKRYKKNYLNRISLISHKPVELFIESANSCNLRCLMCAITYQAPPTDSPIVPLDIIEKLRGFNPELLQTHLHGFGEPLMNRNLTAIISSMHKAGGPVLFDFFTNAMLMSRRVSESLIDAGVHRIILSIDGSTKETYEAIHRGAKWERLLKNLSDLNDLKKIRGAPYPELEINFIAMNMNFHELPGLVILAAKQCIRKIDVKNLVFESHYPMVVQSQHRIYDPERDDHIIAEANSIAKKYGIELYFDHYYSSRASSNSSMNAIEESPTSEVVGRIIPSQEYQGHDLCFQPWKTFYVKSNGEVKPCCFSRTLIMGNLHRETPEEIWNGAEYRKLRESISQGIYPEGCQKCVAHNLRPRLDDTDHWLNVIVQRERFDHEDNLSVQDTLSRATVDSLSRLDIGGLDGTDEKIYQNAQVCIEEGRLSEAITLIEDIIASKGDKPLWHNDLGCLHYALGNTSKAKDCFEKAVETDSTFVVALKNLADLYHTIENHTGETIALYRKILAQSPDDVEILFAISQLCSQTGNIGEAISFLSHALDINSEHIEARALYDSLLMRGERTDIPVTVELGNPLAEAGFMIKRNMERREMNTRGKCDLKILLTNHHLTDFTGSEVFTFTIADFLKRKGARITVLSKYVDDSIRRYFEQIGVKVVQDIANLGEDTFDVAHIHHNVMAMEVRRRFPNLPLVFLSHGVLPFLEQNPPIDIGISYYLAVSEEVRENILRLGISEQHLEIFRNIVDSNKFSPRTVLPARPSRALILSNKLDEATEKTIKSACGRLGIATNFAGMRFGVIHQDYLPFAINQADIVFTLGRGVIEAMMCGRVPIVLDYLGGDGMVTPDNLEHLMKRNFSSRTYNRKFDVDELVKEIELYQPSFGNVLREKALDLFDADHQIGNLINIYGKVLSSGVPSLDGRSEYLIDAFLSTIDTTRHFSHVEASRTNRHTNEQNRDNAIAQKVDSHISSCLKKVKSSSRGGKNESDMCQHLVHSYDILIPIYNAFDHLQRCIDSVIRHTQSDHSIYLLDDCSTDPRVLPLLRSYEGEDQRIHVITAPENRGFIHNVNHGFGLSQNDVVILNSDTEVTEGWLDRMHRCRASHPDIGIVCPLSNNATILSVPAMSQSNSLPEGMDPNRFSSLVAEVSHREYPEIPTGVGFCMLITRETLNLTGFFDPAFGLGYGEENDLCMKARSVGKKIICCNDAYVHHYGEASFSTVSRISERRKQNEKLLNQKWPLYTKEVYDFCCNNPLREIQERIYNRIKEIRARDLPSILHVIHNFDAPGGTELHTRSIIDGLSSRFHSTVIFPASMQDQWTDLAARDVNKNLRVLKLRRESFRVDNSFLEIPGDLTNKYVENVFSNFLSGGNYRIVHFQHLSGWNSLLLPLIAKHQGCKVLISLHDYYLLCPEYNLILPNLKRCGKSKADGNDADCQYCLGIKRRYHGDGTPLLLKDYLEERKQVIKRVFEAADILISPSDYVRERFIQAYGEVINGRIITIPHGIEPLQEIHQPKRDKSFRIAFLGNASDRKGVFVLLQVAQLLKDMPVRFEIFGGIPPSLTKLATNLGIIQHGFYVRSNLPQLLAKTHLVMVPAICEETFCFTVSESQMMGIPVLASDCGAISEKIIDGETGFLSPAGDAKALAVKILEILGNPFLLEKVASNLRNYRVKTMEENVEDYARIYNHLIDPAALSHLQEALVQSLHQTNINPLAYSKPLPLTSIIILCFNGLDYTRQCLDSIKEFTPEPHEIVIVDNGSTDGTHEFLRRYANKYSNVKIITNESNAGYAVGNNQGIKAVQGDYIVLLNNDVVVTSGWLTRMIGHLEESCEVGMVGPVSNSVSGAQLIHRVPYSNNLSQMHNFAREIEEKNAGQTESCMRLVGFCLLVRKEVLEIIGGLDEGYMTGNFEDDDLCLRSWIAGYRNVIAKDVFVHHFGSMSFKENSIDYSCTMDTNRSHFLEKWKEIVHEIENNAYHVSLEKSHQVEYLIKWGESAYGQGDILRALKIFERILRIEPQSTTVLNNLGVIQWELGDKDAAIETFQTVLRIRPNDPDALMNLSSAIDAGGRIDLLCQEVRALIERRSDISPETNQQAVARDSSTAMNDSHEKRICT